MNERGNQLTKLILVTDWKLGIHRDGCEMFGLATPHRRMSRMFFSPRLRMSRLPLFNIRWWLVLSNNRITDDHTLGGYLSDQAGTRLTPSRLNFFRERIFRS